MMTFATKLRAAAVLAFAAATAPTAAFAYITDAGEEAGPGMSVLETILWFVVGPASIIGAISLIWAISGWRKQHGAGSINPKNEVAQR